MTTDPAGVPGGAAHAGTCPAPPKIDFPPTPITVKPKANLARPGPGGFTGAPPEGLGLIRRITLENYMSHALTVIEPVAAHLAAYAEAYQRYRRLFAALKPMFEDARHAAG